jgi:hypothetical protein
MQALALAHALGDRWSEPDLHAGLGNGAIAQGQVALARHQYEEALAMFEAISANADAARLREALPSCVPVRRHRTETTRTPHRQPNRL